MHVRKVDKVQPGVLARSEAVPLEVAARRVYNAGLYDTPAAAEAALLTGDPVETHYCVYQLIAGPSPVI